MTTLTDTSPEAEGLLIDLLRQTPVWRKLALMGQLNAMAHSLALSNLRRQHPAASEAELRRRLADRLLGTELAAAAYGPLSAAATIERGD
jgi:hypothetical protein